MNASRSGLGACCATTRSSMCFWTAVFLLAYGAALILRATWPTLGPYENTLLLSALAVACFVNFGRNRTYHCVLTGPLFLAGAVVAALTTAGLWHVPAGLLWGAVAMGTGVAFVLEWRGRAREIH